MQRNRVALEVVKVGTAVDGLVEIQAIPTGQPQGPLAALSLQLGLTMLSIPHAQYLMMGAPREGEVLILGSGVN